MFLDLLDGRVRREWYFRFSFFFVRYDKSIGEISDEVEREIIREIRKWLNFLVYLDGDYKVVEL